MSLWHANAYNAHATFWANQQLCPLLLSKIYLYIAARKCIQCFLLNSFITCLAPSPKAEEPWLVRAAKPHTILTHRQIGKYRVRFSTVTSAECMIPHLQIYQPIRYFPIHMPLSCVMYLQLQLLYITKSQHNGMKKLSIFACSGSTCSSKRYPTRSRHPSMFPPFL